MMRRSYVSQNARRYTPNRTWQALQQELAYAGYLNITTAILPPPRNRDFVASYARAVNSCLKAAPYTTLSVRLPIYDPNVFQRSPPAENGPTSLGSQTLLQSPQTPVLVVSEVISESPQHTETSLNATWEMWDLIRSMCDYNPRLTLSMPLLHHPLCEKASDTLQLWIYHRRSQPLWECSTNGLPNPCDTSSCQLPRLSRI